MLIVVRNHIDRVYSLDETGPDGYWRFFISFDNMMQISLKIDVAHISYVSSMPTLVMNAVYSMVMFENLCNSLCIYLVNFTVWNVQV